VADIDGTLMDEKKEILKQDIQAINDAVDNGVGFCLASGRMEEEINIVKDQLGISCFSVCQNGATVVDMTGQIIRSNVFKVQLAQSVLKAAWEHQDLVTIICNAKGNFVHTINPKVEQVGQRFLTPLRVEPQIKKLISCGEFQVTKFSIYGSVPALEKMLRTLDHQLNDHITSFFSDPDGIDVMPGGVDKGAGIEAIMDLEKIESKDVACIGDSFNDIAMFQVSGQSFAMSQAKVDVKKEAKFIVNNVSSALSRFLTSSISDDL